MRLFRICFNKLTLSSFLALSLGIGGAFYAVKGLINVSRENDDSAVFRSASLSEDEEMMRELSQQLLAGTSVDLDGDGTAETMGMIAPAAGMTSP